MPPFAMHCETYWFSVIPINIAVYIFEGFIGTTAIREQTAIVEIILFLVFGVFLVLLPDVHS